jgi:hypothetical protein
MPAVLGDHLGGFVAPGRVDGQIVVAPRGELMRFVEDN